MAMSEPRRDRVKEDLRGWLRLCLRGRRDQAAMQAACRQALSKGMTAGEFDWDAACHLAETEGVASLLYRILRNQDWVPPSALQALRSFHDGIILLNTVLFHHLEEVLECLAEVGITAILLKGAALSKIVYGKTGARGMGDLDLLVSREDAPTAIGAISALGYARSRIAPRPGSDLVYENEVMLCKPGIVDVFVEVHWNLFDSPHHQQRLPLAWFWGTATAVSIGKASALVLGPEAQILHLCGHLYLHHGNVPEPRLLWLNDIAEVLEQTQDQIDWEELLARARDCDLVLPVQQVLIPAAEEWGARVPQEVLAQLRRLRPSPAEEKVFARLTAGPRPAGQRFRDDLASLPEWRVRLGFAWVNLLPSPAYMRQRYQIRHSALVPLYYLYRWLLGLRSALC